jgi:selenocysteine lyase/cysteine desulfurase
VRLPQGCDGAGLERRLWVEHRIEVPVMRPEKDLLRLSVAAYTRREDVERLLAVLPGALRASRGPRAPRSVESPA